MKEVEYVRNEIRNSGFLSNLQIVLRLAKYSPGISREKLDSILSSILCKDIHKVAYTNSYVSSLKLKDLYYYNPVDEKMAQRKKKTKKIVK